MGKAGRQRFYQAFERMLERLRRRLDEMLSALADVLLKRMSIAECDRAWKSGPFGNGPDSGHSGAAAGIDGKGENGLGTTDEEADSLRPETRAETDNATLSHLL